MSLFAALIQAFGEASSIPLSRINNLLRLAWTGDMTSEALRALCWRIFLSQLSAHDKYEWPGQLLRSVEDYRSLKARVMPSIDKVKDDPLSALSAGDGGMSTEWSAYYKNLELTNFIKGDLDRLYLGGMDDEYFQTTERRTMLIEILFIWSLEHPMISYRQGMHEVVGAILYVVECELTAWEAAKASPDFATTAGTSEQALSECFIHANVEAYTYCLFDRILLELMVLYDPLQVTGIESQPFVVHYCTKIQEHYLGLLDPRLCRHLEENYLQAQIYGLRWSRLLLGREFPMTHEYAFRLWDFMFASCFEAECNSMDAMLDEDIQPNVYSVFAQVRFQGHKKDSNANKHRQSTTDRVTYVITPLLGALADFMLAMLIHVRDILLDGDQNVVMGSLMHYPKQDSIRPILELADMIRRGVLVRHIDGDRGAVLNYFEPAAPSTPQHNNNKRGTHINLIHNSNNSNSATKQRSTGNGGQRLVQGVGKQITNLGHAVGVGFSDLMSTIADVTGLDEPPTSSYDGYIGDVDPLTGARMTTITTVLTTKPNKPKQSQQQAPPSLATATIVNNGNDRSKRDASPLPMPVDKAYSMLFDDANSSTSNSNSGKVINNGTGISLFKPREWFQSSPKPHNDSSTTYHPNRGVSTRGVNLSEFGGVDASTTAGGEEIIHHPVPHHKKEVIAQNHTVADRLKEIAEYLHQFNNSSGGSNDEEEEDGCLQIAKRLTTLAKVLNGESSVVDYDMKYASKSLPTSLVATQQSSVTPLSPILEEEDQKELNNKEDA